MASKLAIVFLFLITALQLIAGDDWNYKDQNWKTIYPQCSGNAQSPINIDTNTVLSAKSQSLQINRSDTSYDWTSTNNGHTLKITFANGPSRTYLAEDRPIILGSTPGSKYILEQFHFHWSENDNSGSEHSINGRKFAGELHLVFYNSKYPDCNAALSQSDGLTVIAFFLEVLPGIHDTNPISNHPLMQIIDSIQKVKKPLTSTPIYGMRLSDLLPYTEQTFYRYKGSLTTPPCSENVEFIIFGKPIPISKSQMDSFRKLNQISPKGKEEPLLNNVRVIQPRNGRTVIASTFIPNKLTNFKFY